MESHELPVSITNPKAIQDKLTGNVTLQKWTSSHGGKPFLRRNVRKSLEQHAHSRKGAARLRLEMLSNETKEKRWDRMRGEADALVISLSEWKENTKGKRESTTGKRESTTENHQLHFEFSTLRLDEIVPASNSHIRRGPFSKFPELHCRLELEVFWGRCLRPCPLSKSAYKKIFRQSQQCTIVQALGTDPSLGRFVMERPLALDMSKLLVPKAQIDGSTISVMESWYTMQISLQPLTSWPRHLAASFGCEPTSNSLQGRARDARAYGKFLYYPRAGSLSKTVSLTPVSKSTGLVVPSRLAVDLDITSRNKSILQTQKKAKNTLSAVLYHFGDGVKDTLPKQVYDGDQQDEEGGREGFECIFCDQDWGTAELLHFHLLTHELFRISVAKQDRESSFRATYIITINTIDVAPAKHVQVDEKGEVDDNINTEYENTKWKAFAWVAPTDKPFVLQDYLNGDESWVTGECTHSMSPVTAAVKNTVKEAKSVVRPTSINPDAVRDIPIRFRKKFAVPPLADALSYHRKDSKRLLEPGEEVSESEDEPEDSWRHQLYDNLVDKNASLSDPQKRFAKLWKDHFLTEIPYQLSSTHLPDAIMRFAKKNFEFLRTNDGYSQFHAKCKVLLRKRAIDLATMKGCLLYLKPITSRLNPRKRCRSPDSVEAISQSNSRSRIAIPDDDSAISPSLSRNRQKPQDLAQRGFIRSGKKPHRELPERPKATSRSLNLQKAHKEKIREAKVPMAEVGSGKEVGLLSTEFPQREKSLPGDRTSESQPVDAVTPAARSAMDGNQRFRSQSKTFGPTTKTSRSLGLDAKPGDYFFVRMKGYQSWPSIIPDEDMLPKDFLSNRPPAAKRQDGSYGEAYVDGGSMVHQRVFPAMFLGSYEL
jgi:VEFS-Box of polycomb protein